MRCIVAAVLTVVVFSGCAHAQAPSSANPPVFNILDYSAKNDGSANAADAFRAAIAAAN
jgi:polygalacturonase